MKPTRAGYCQGRWAVSLFLMLFVLLPSARRLHALPVLFEKLNDDHPTLLLELLRSDIASASPQMLVQRGPTPVLALQTSVALNSDLTTVTGQVLDTNGAAGAGVAVSVNVLAGLTTTDAEGRYTIVGVPAGSGDIVVSAFLNTTAIPLAASSTPITPFAGGQTDVPTLVLQPGLPGMVYVPPGASLMGSPVNEASRLSREAQHEVTLTRAFWMGAHEVTQGEYSEVMGNNPSYFRNGTPSYGNAGVVTNELKHPVERVSWLDATNYCAKRTAHDRGLEKIPGGWGYRLPTEAEWEYACRAGTMTAFYFGPALKEGMANFDIGYEYDSTLGPIITGKTYLGRTTEVGNYAANSFGLYDMHGNVAEWCQDWYEDWGGGYPGSVTDPAGPATGSVRVIRSWAWDGEGRSNRSANRTGGPPGSYSNDTGFRVVLAPAPGVNRLSQTIAFDPLPDKRVGDAPFNLTASVSSGLLLSYSSSDPTVATVSDGTVTLVGPGTTTITATQAGDADYLPASAARTLTVVSTIRRSPAGYWPGAPITVELEYSPKPGTFVHTVTDQIPSARISELVANYFNADGVAISYAQGPTQVGLPATDINEDGIFDSASGTVRWGPFFDDTPRLLHYTIVPPFGWSTPITLNGTLSQDGQGTPLPTQTLNLLPFHPADIAAPTNHFITIFEMSAYATTWRRSLYWPIGPNPIPVDGNYVTQAGVIWKKGEHYAYVGGAAPSCWQPAAVQTPPPPPSPQWGEEASWRPGPSFASVGVSQPSAATGTAVRSCPAAVNPPAPFIVSIRVTPTPDTAVYLVEEQLPAGWTATGISSGGAMDTSLNKVKWGPFFSAAPRTLSYTATPPDGVTGKFVLSGLAAFDGTVITVSGSASVLLGSVQPDLPIITTQPASQTVIEGQNAIFTVIATSSTPLSYQWRKEEADIREATNDTFTLTAVQSDQAGHYTVVVGNGGGSVTSSPPAVLTVLVPPKITVQPQSLSVALTSNATFNVTVTSDLPVRYQWRFNGMDLLSATNASLTISKVTTMNAGAYAVVVSNAAGAVNSHEADLLFFGNLNFYAGSAGITLGGPIGREFRVEYTDLIDVGPMNWLTLTNLTLLSSPYLLIDPTSAGKPQRYYRAVTLP